MDRIISKVLHTPELTLKGLHCVMKVVEVGSVSRAAKQIAKSQTAVTKAIHKVEKSIGKSLFDRSTSGMWPTAEGELLAGRVSNAFNELQRAGRLEAVPNSALAAQPTACGLAHPRRRNMRHPAAPVRPLSAEGLRRRACLCPVRTAISGASAFAWIGWAGR